MDISKERDRFGSYFVGLKIRDINDNSPPLITGNSEVITNVNCQPENINVINRLWTMVMVKVTDMMDYVMGESTVSDRCDGCDGIIEKSSELENSVESKVNCNTNDKEDLETEEISDKILKMPSQFSHEQGQSHIEQGVTNYRSAPHSSRQGGIIRASITVGDLVTVDDCPGHWSWASPFTVEGIDGEMVKLEMVSELVNIARLEKYCFEVKTDEKL